MRTLNKWDQVHERGDSPFCMLRSVLTPGACCNPSFQGLDRTGTLSQCKFVSPRTTSRLMGQTPAAVLLLCSLLSLPVQHQHDCPRVLAVVCLPQITKGFSFMWILRKISHECLLLYHMGNRFALLFEMKMWFKIQDCDYCITNLYVNCL